MKNFLLGCGFLGGIVSLAPWVFGAVLWLIEHILFPYFDWAFGFWGLS